jgi:hypothetical protein
MHRALSWIGGLFCVAGAVLIAANLALAFLGLGASYNLGDPAKFEFILVPFWQIGLGVAVVGGLCLLSRRWARRPSDG